MKTKQLYQLFLQSNLKISTDTRKIEKGSLFFAIKGENFDGNEFAKAALEAGAKYAIIDNPKFATGENYIVVKNVLIALQDLANHHRRKFDIPVVGITGSNGKTTTKELVAAVLQKKYNILVTEGNLNNHLGVPFTLLRMRKEHEIAIIEMGANKPGDIEELCEIAEPTLGLITNVGKAHLEGFGSFEGVIQTKTELYDAIEYANGGVFINSDDVILMKNAPSVDIFTYGSNGQVKSEVVGLNPFLSFSWSISDYHAPTIQTQLVGSYNLSNFTVAATLGVYFDVPFEDINEALAAYTPSNNRSQITKINSNTLIVDCYNANPTSMMTALESFEQVPAEHKIAIIGDMRELGKIAQEEHQAVVDWIESKKLKAILVGEEFGKTNKQLPHFANVDEIIAHLNTPENKLADHFILLKGSRGIQLEKTIAANCFE